MIDILSLGSFIAFVIILFAMIYIIIRSYSKLRTLEQIYLQEVSDKNAILQKLSEMVNEKQNYDIEKTDGFIRFVSESRDWAFKYIEDVQDSISSLKLAVENGSNTEEEMEKLFNFLPDNKENNNE